MSTNKARRNHKPWPKDCIWPEPFYDGAGLFYDADDADMLPLDEEGEDLLEIRDYYDSLIEDGVLDEEYHLTTDYAEKLEPAGEEFIPEIGDEYWNDGFDDAQWLFDMQDHLNRLKIDISEHAPASVLRQITGYEFINENLLRQAFTRRAFAIEYGLPASSEELEFYGDTVLNTIVTKELYGTFARIDTDRTAAPFISSYDEGDLTKLRSRFVSKEHLSEKAGQLGLDRFVLYGTGEEPTESASEDAVEALIGAVAVDCGWDWNVLESVVDRLVCVQLTDADRYLQTSYYEIFNAWHQKHFGVIPDYTIDRFRDNAGDIRYSCIIRFQVPENDIGVRTSQIHHEEWPTRSKAREIAAEMAYRFVLSKGLWINLKDAHLVPDPERSINQLQELYQKKYVEDLPLYEFTEMANDRWRCDCRCGGINGHGEAGSKVRAKKKAAYMVLVELLESAGICEEEWKDRLYEMMII